MESFLNILWLLFATSAVLLWQLHWVQQKRAAQRNRVQQWTAFLCGLVLLFFAVSLTDDLHSEIVFYEECANGRRHSLVCGVAQAIPAHGARIPAVGGGGRELGGASRDWRNCGDTDFAGRPAI